MLVPFSVILVPLAFLVSVRWLTSDELDDVTVDSTPFVVTAAPRHIDERTDVQVHLVWAPRVDLIAPSWNGVVTAVYLSSGDRITSGTRLLSVDGIDRFSFHSDAPFYRRLSRGEFGRDVEQLHQLLNELGYLSALPVEPAMFGADTEDAVVRLMFDLGAPNAVGSFDPAVVVWLPIDSIVLDELTATVAAPAPSPGSRLGTSAPELLLATFSSQDPAQSLLLDSSVEYVLTVGGHVLAADPSTQSVAPEDLDLLEQIAFSTMGGAQEPTGAGAIGPRDSLTGTISRSTPLETLAVPSTSVVTGPGGELCVWIVVEGTYQPVSVVVHQSLAGVASIQGDLVPEAAVLANPASVLESPACP
ncbi:MAG: hypothetical protein Kow0010_27070 [Dehalococcoidia bacterium]